VKGIPINQLKREFILLILLFKSHFLLIHIYSYHNYVISSEFKCLVIKK